MNYYDTHRIPRRRFVLRSLKSILDASEMVPDTIWWDDENEDLPVVTKMTPVEKEEKHSCVEEDRPSGRGEAGRCRGRENY